MEKKLLWRMFFVVVVITIVVGVLFAQQASDPKYKPNEVQELKLQLKQKDAQLAQRAAQDAQQAYVRAVQDYSAFAEEIKKTNGWPAEVRFDLNNAVFLEPPKEAKAPEKKPAEPSAKK